jgi:hypothetical protein
VWVDARIKTDGPRDYAAVHKIQAGFKVTPLSHWGRAYVPPAVRIDPSVDMETPPKRQVEQMTARDFFTYASELLTVVPPHLTDQPILARMRRIGFDAGKRFDFASLDPSTQAALASAPKEALALMVAKMPVLAKVVNGWEMNIDSVGVYGNYYLKRAITAQFGLGANLPEDALYPLSVGDNTGKPLDGSNRYTLHFEKGTTPPADAFWSVSLYDAEGFPVANPLERYAVSSWMPLVPNADGSLDLYIQSESPGKPREPNWLPAPKGPFGLVLRIYSPRPEVLTGDWNPPPIVRQTP